MIRNLCFYLGVLLTNISLACTDKPVVSSCTDLESSTVSDIETCAKSGDLASQFTLARLFFTGGRGVLENMEKSFKWTLAAANQDCPSAQRLAGHLYYYGQGVPPSAAKAMEWFEIAAKNNDKAAACQLGIILIKGEITPVDEERGFTFIKQASDLGHLQCKGTLAYLLYNGIGSEPDRKKAKQLFTELEKNGDPKAKKALQTWSFD